MKKFICVSAVFVVAAMLTCRVSAYEIPLSDSRAEYFYAFGAYGRAHDGADLEDRTQSIFFEVPKSQTEGLTIDVFDPDTGGRLDQKPSKNRGWETIIEFSVLGDDGAVLARQRFGESARDDMQYFRFGPFAKEKGEDSGDFYRFRLVVRPVQTYLLQGDELNLFRVRVSPEDVETSADEVYFRLSRRKGEEMYFYPLIPAGVSEIVAENYDLDPNGGTASLFDPLTNKSHPVQTSASGQWASTTIDVGAADHPRRAVYVITRKTQAYGNAAVRVKDAEGNPIAMYFSKTVRTVAPASVPARESKPVQTVRVRTEEPEPKQPPKRKIEARSAPVKRQEPRPAPRIAAAPEKQGSAPCNRFTFDGTASYDPNNEKLTFFWDFGDGTTATEPIATHVFEKGGLYTVTLTVKDTSGLACDTSTTTYQVKVNMPPVAVLQGPEDGCVKESLVFDAGASTDDTPESLTYIWDFGDGTRAEGRQVTKQFDQGGVRTVRLTVNDNAGSACSTVTAEKQVSINTPPVARAGEDVTLCLSGEKEYAVVFDAGRSTDADGDELTYAWDFGDGESAAAKTVTHVYEHGGRYKARLVVDDGRSQPCSTSEDTVLVILNKQPVADAGEDKVSCVAMDVLFDASSSSDADNDELTYAWDFGDGESGQGQKVHHAYERPGDYKAVLTIDDGRQTDCSKVTAAVDVFVNRGPAAAIAEVQPACAGAKVNFDASATTGTEPAKYRYSWDFGDGTILESGAKVAHEYNAPGRYIVSVTVDDRRNTPCSVDRASTEIKINTPPEARAVTEFACCIDTDSVFDGSSSSDADGDELSFRWDFGDGSTAEGIKARHRYAKGGIYTVTLHVDDNSGTACGSSRSQVKVNINDQPVAVIKVR